MRCMTRGGGVVGSVAVGLVVAGTVVGSTAAQTHPGSSSSSPRLARVARSARVISCRAGRGAKIKAFYEERGAKLVATRIEVSSGG